MYKYNFNDTADMTIFNQTISVWIPQFPVYSTQ